MSDTPSCVVDASVIIKWVIVEPDSPAAEGVLHYLLHAPDYWRVECANVLWRLHRRGVTTAEETHRSLANLKGFPIVSHASDLLLDQALSLSMMLPHPVYDCVYLALAMERDVTLVTADKKFHAAVTKHSRLRKYIRLL